jgi:hypothetical protein
MQRDASLRNGYWAERGAPWADGGREARITGVWVCAVKVEFNPGFWAKNAKLDRVFAHFGAFSGRIVAVCASPCAKLVNPWASPRKAKEQPKESGGVPWAEQGFVVNGVIPLIVIGRKGLGRDQRAEARDADGLCADHSGRMSPVQLWLSMIRKNIGLTNS